MGARYQLPPTARMLVSSRWQVRRKLTNGTDDASGRQQIGGTKRPQNARMPLNGCNSELTTRWLASACCRSCDRLASQLARKREDEGCTRPAKRGKLISTALPHEVVHTDKKRQRYLEYPAREVSKGGSACQFYETVYLLLVSRIYLAEYKNVYSKEYR